MKLIEVIEQASEKFNIPEEVLLNEIARFIDFYLRCKSLSDLPLSETGSKVMTVIHSEHFSYEVGTILIYVMILDNALHDT